MGPAATRGHRRRAPAPRAPAGAPACATKATAKALKWTVGGRPAKAKLAGSAFRVVLSGLKPGAGGRVCVGVSAAPAGCRAAEELCGGPTCAVRLETAPFSSAAAFGGGDKNARACCALSASVPAKGTQGAAARAAKPPAAAGSRLGAGLAVRATVNARAHRRR
jgi:hypothetical protein